MAHSIGVICSEDGTPLQVEYRGLPPNNEVLRGVLAVRPGGNVVFEQLDVQPIIAEVDDAADFRLRTDEEILRARSDAGLNNAQLGSVRSTELDSVAARRTVPAAPPQPAPSIAEAPQPAPPAPAPPAPPSPAPAPAPAPAGPPAPPQPPASVPQQSPTPDVKGDLDESVLDLDEPGGVSELVRQP